MASSSTSSSASSSASTVVGVFDSREHAEQARQELIQAGIRQDAVRIVPQQAAATGTTSSSSSSSSSSRGGQDEGVWDSIKDFFGFSDDEDVAYYREASRRGGTMVQVTVSDQTQIDRVVTVFERYNAVDLDQRSQQWRTEGWQGYQSTQRTQAAAGATAQTSQTTQHQAKAGEQASIPVVEEQLQVGKRAVRRGGVRIHTHVTERPVEAQVNLREEHVRVERHAVNRPASEADFNAASRQGSIEVTETAEVPVVAKQARVVEEVVVGKESTERTEKVRDTVRKTDVDVEQVERTSEQSSSTKANPNQQPGRSGSSNRDRV